MNFILYRYHHFDIAFGLFIPLPAGRHALIFSVFSCWFVVSGWTRRH